MKRNILWLSAILALALFLVVACTPAEKTGTPTTEPATNAEKSTVTETKEAPATEEKKTDNELGELVSLIKTKQTLKFMVEWETKSTVQGTTYTSTMTQYIKDQKHFRTDVTTQGIETRSYLVDDTFTSCVKMMDKWTCNAIAQPAATDNSEKELLEGKAGYTVTQLPDKTVAGTTATCYRMTMAQGTVDYCFSAEGVPLYIKSEVQGVSSEMTAQKYSVSVDDSAFVLPQ
ncbi:MAG: hypothetical protein V2A62_03135 [Candidatus Woesearchaeota archaeon]